MRQMDRKSHLDIARSAIEIEMNLLDVSKLSKHFVYVILLRFLVNASGHDDPTLDGCPIAHESATQRKPK